jgi:Ca2+/Na+ antiporter
MPFFLIVPAWLMCVVGGIVLLFFQRFRRAGLYTINISTTATVGSLVLSTAVLYLGPRIGLQRIGRWSGVAMVGAYLLAIGTGALIGAVIGLLFTRKLLLPKLPQSGVTT